MKIKEKLMMDGAGLAEHGPINIVIFGDSVSHGAINDYMDYENVYWNRLKKRLNAVRDFIPVNMINASIGGTTAKLSLMRLDKQVLKHEPDLVIVCFGLNDVNYELEDYIVPLEEIFSRLKCAGVDTVFMTPNMLNTRVADDTPKRYYDYAIKTAEMQNSGKMDRYIEAAIEVAKRLDVPVCDCYAKWREMSKISDTTMLLANRINHPTPEMHALFSDALFEMIIGADTASCESYSTMYKE